MSVPPTHQLDNPGDAGDSSCIKRRFDLASRSWTEFEGTRYYNGEAALAAIRFIEYQVSSDTALAHGSSHTQAERAALTVGTALAHLLPVPQQFLLSQLLVCTPRCPSAGSIVLMTTPRAARSLSGTQPKGRCQVRRQRRCCSTRVSCGGSSHIRNSKRPCPLHLRVQAVLGAHGALYCARWKVWARCDICSVRTRIVRSVMRVCRQALY